MYNGDVYDFMRSVHLYRFFFWHPDEIKENPISLGRRVSRVATVKFASLVPIGNFTGQARILGIDF